MSDDLVKPVAHRYRYKDPFTGIPVWRGDCDLWNGQRPYEREALYNLEAVEALIAERDALAAEVERLREAIEVFADDRNWFDVEVVEEGQKYPAWRGPTEYPEGFARAALEGRDG